MPDYVIDWTKAKLLLRWTKGEPHRVSLIGDREKLLYEGNSTLVAQKTYTQTMKHYEARKGEEDDPTART